MNISERKIFDAEADLAARTEGRSKALFLRGPIPFDWIGRACSDPADRLALILRAFFVIKRTSELRVTMEICRYAGIPTRHQRRRCLARLERTGLFEVSASKGRSPVIRKKW